jgi:ribosomal protein L7Ae-like RNA K-turn-binding protein
VANVVVSALATWNGKALKKAKQDVDVFSKQIKQFGRVFGVAFSATALVAFSKKAVKAFAEDEAAAKSLALQLENTGNAFRVTEVEAYIKSLEKTYAILTDLRAPFQTLLNVTGSVDLAQRSLEAALDISAGTGENLATVVGAIAAGVRGQTKAINGLNTGIDKNILATGDMNKIMAELEKKFSGQAAARLDTYAGKMDVLKKGADEATKSIGTGLVDALVILSKDQSIEGLATDFENLGNNIAFAIVEMAKLIKKFNDLVDNPSFKAGLLALAILSKKPSAVIGAFGIIGLDAASSALTSSRSTTKSNIGGYSGIPLQKAENKAIKDGVAYRKQENALLKAKNAVDQLKDKFDLERIGLAAALNAATDEETKLRIKAQIAILDNNEALAKKLLAEMEAAEAAKKLALALGTVGDATIEYFKKLAESLVGTMGYFNMSMQQILNERLKESGKISLGGGMTGGGFTPLTADYFQNLGTQLQGSSAYAGMSAGQISLERARESGNRSLDVNLVVSAPSGNAFAQLVAESIQVAGRDGYSTTPNGGLR